jgi:predicted nuclease of predicted toxin-antitoxin system
VKFIIDAQLPKKLSDLLISKGHDSIHTLDLPSGNHSKDNELITISKREKRIIITKDNDFLKSYIIKGLPEKLIIIKTGNIGNNELLKIFEKNIDKIELLLKKNTLIEITNNKIIVQLRKV